MQPTRGTSRGRAGKVLGLALACSMIAVACGSDSKETTDTTAGSGTTVAGGAGSTAAGGAGSVSTIAETKTDDAIKRGGKLQYALEAETATGFSAIYSNIAISGETVMRAIYDPVMAISDDGKTHGVLAESMTPNADATQWIIKLRSGIKFHDGSDWNAAALKAYMEAGRCSPLVATAWGEFGGCPSTFDPAKPEDPKTNRKPVSTIYKAITPDAADPLKLVVDMLAPYALLEYAGSTWWPSSPKIIADQAATQKTPIGTGPFAFKEWVVNDHLTVTKNPSYWLKAPDGQPYPYLDEITFRPFDDVAARENCLRGGQCDMLQTANGDTISKFRSEKDDWSLYENSVGAETAHVMFNVAPTIGGAENPLADVNVRRGLVACTNLEEFNKLRNADVSPVANGPYPPGVDGYLADPGYPKYDPVEGKKLIDAYKAAKGISGDLEIKFGTTADPFNRGSNELTATYWKKCGVQGTIDQTEQGQYITRALVGDFQAFGWRNFGGLNPDRNYVWWLSAFATDAPGVALNFGRIKDPAIDAGLTKIRQSTDPAVRKAAAEDVNKAFGAGAYNLWYSWTVWQLVGQTRVQNMGGSWNAPDGARVSNTARVSQHSFHSIWVK